MATLKKIVLTSDEVFTIVESLSLRAAHARLTADTLLPSPAGPHAYVRSALLETADQIATLADRLRHTTVTVEPDPLSRCPKCGAMPLADDGERRLLCEPCNQWYDVTGRK